MSGVLRVPSARVIELADRIMAGEQVGCNDGEERYQVMVELTRRIADQLATKELLARACSWCGKWLSAYDERLARQGAKVTHTICPDCHAKHFPEDPL